MAISWAPRSDAATSVFYVPLNRAELVSSDRDLGEVIVTDPDVADVYVHGKRKVSVIGKHIGQTTMRLFDSNRKLVRSMDVYVTYDLPAIRRALKQFLPGERVGVSMVNTRIALTGDVTSAQSAATAMELAEEFVRGKLADGEADTRKALGTSGQRSPVINLMKVAAAQQVMLRIKVGEVQRSAVKNLGVSLQAFGDSGPDFLLGTGIGRVVAAAAGGTAGNGAPSFQYGRIQQGGDAFFDGAIYTGGRQGVGAALEALERDGLLKVLAEPNLTALSGEEAQFLAGGEFPIPVPQQLGTTTIEYKPFGVALKFTPYVISDSRIRIQVNPEVSEPSNDSAIRTTDGFVAPSFVTRRASTTVELAPGESFMIAGLLSDRINSQIDQLPGAGNIPVLGALFRSTAYQHSETELVISVTPYLVDPIKDGDLKLPTDDFRPASFMESIFFGALASNRGNKDASAEGPSGFMTDN
ncbi:MAG: type II and III secretion system protein family protein [Rickettsiales bacterium]